MSKIKQKYQEYKTSHYQSFSEEGSSWMVMPWAGRVSGSSQSCNASDKTSDLTLWDARRLVPLVKTIICCQWLRTITTVRKQKINKNLNTVSKLKRTESQYPLYWKYNLLHRVINTYKDASSSIFLFVFLFLIPKPISSQMNRCVR